MQRSVKVDTEKNQITLEEERRTGVVSAERLKLLGYIPNKERLYKGPVAIFECVEPIPCNVCVFACPFNAVQMEKITDMPKVDFDRCTGCALCVAQCPGQAIYVVDLSSKDSYGYVTLQYDMTLPPKPGDKVKLLDNKGREIGEGIVRLSYKHKRSEVYVVKVEVPKDLVMVVKAIKVLR